MTNLMIGETCEVCGKPASFGVQDIIERDNLDTGYVEREVDGPPHYFCDEHKREPDITRLGIITKI